MAVTTRKQRRRRRLIRVITVSIAAAALTISLKFVAWLMTGSLGLLADAAESVINLVGAAVALVVILWATRPADEEHSFGHEKADHLAAGFEGALILLAAVSIAWAAVHRLLNPIELEAVGIGVALTALATVINFAVAGTLLRVGREENSPVLDADGRHLMTDVWTGSGVVAGVAVAGVTGWHALDPVIALIVAANIVRTGFSLVRESLAGLMDRAMPPEALAVVNRVLDGYASDEIGFHALRTRIAGPRYFISVHVLVPGEWTVQRGHDLVEQLEQELRSCFDQATVFTHLEPLEDPASFADTDLDRETDPH